MISSLSIQQSLCDFSIKLYDQLVTFRSENRPHSRNLDLPQVSSLGNIFISPLSIFTALSTTLLGCAGATKAELASVLGLPEQIDELQLQSAISAITLCSSNPLNHEDVSMANRLFILKGRRIKKKYMESDVIHVEDISAMISFDAKRRHINEWVASSTGGKIQHLIPSGCLKANSALLIANAIYFNGSWQSAFDKQDTEEAEFYRLDGSAMFVQMMYLEEDFDYVDLPEMDARAIKLPFKEEKWVMLIVLPNQNDGLNSLISKLVCDGALNTLLSITFLPKRITLYLPRFKMKESVNNLKLALANLGTNRLFSETECDLSGISPDRPLFVSDIFHRAMLEVDERGARATATTDLCASDGIGDYFNECFRVDHPFFVALLGPNNTVAFMGHVTSPSDL